MSSIMRWRNGLMGLSVMAITPVSHEVSEPHDLETGRAILFIPTSNPPRARSRRGVYRESGLVLGGRADVEDRPFACRYAPIDVIPSQLAASRKPTLDCGPPKRRERARKADPSRLRKCVQR